MEIGNGGSQRAPGFLAYLPVAWLALVLLLSARSLVAAWPLLSDYRLPDAVVDYVYVNMAAGAAILLWGLYVLTLAIGRSSRFRRHFVAWQTAVIAWTLTREAYAAAVPDFVFSPLNLALAAGEIVIGLFCIWLASRNRDAALLYSAPETAGRSPLVTAIRALLGAVVGAALGSGAGLGAGSLVAETTDMSCFEGACGYFAFFLGLGGLVLGAVGGALLAVRRGSRRAGPSQ